MGGTLLGGMGRRTQCKIIKNSSKEKYYEVNPDIKKVANEQLDYWLGKFVLEIRKKKEPGSV